MDSPSDSASGQLDTSDPTVIARSQRDSAPRGSAGVLRAAAVTSLQAEDHPAVSHHSQTRVTYGPGSLMVQSPAEIKQ